MPDNSAVVASVIVRGDFAERAGWLRRIHGLSNKQLACILREVAQLLEAE